MLVPRSRSFLKYFKVWLSLTLSGILLLIIILLSSDVGPRVFEHQRILEVPTNFLEEDTLLMDEPKVIKRLSEDFLIPPMKDDRNHVYHLEEPDTKDPSMGQSEKIRTILHNKRNGFFIECGALDGETRSNTLYMERYLDWTGLLIEADPLNFAQMVQKNRKSWLSPTCLSKTPHPQVVSFKQDFNVGRISENKVGQSKAGYVDVQCFPIYSYLVALNVSQVDYFSLDIEGDELDVLKTIPFDKVDIQTLSVEFAHVDDGKDTLKEFMTSQGYNVVAEITHPNWLANDFIFVKNNLVVT